MSSGRMGTMLIAMATVVVLGSAVASLSIMESPAAQREARIDERRTRDLVQIRNAVQEHWERNQALPASLAELAKTPGLPLPLEDPNGGPAYEYRVTGESAYELCASFGTDTAEVSAGRPQRFGNDWLHAKGRHCFKRTTDTKDDAT